MKASFFVSLPYGRVSEPVATWPVPNRLFDAEHAVASTQSHLEEVELADQLGFDWIGCAEHRGGPRPTPAQCASKSKPCARTGRKS